MSSSKASKRTFSKKQWDEMLKRLEISREDLNKLVMNYLVVEGYKDAASEFQKESSTDPGVDLEEIEERMRVRLDIQNGDIEAAMSHLNDLNPEILDTRPDLYFQLQRQRFIEYIRAGDMQKALEFAQEELAPRAEENPEFLEDLEATMALLAFDDKGSSPVGDLLSVSQRNNMASDVNAAILESMAQEKEPKLPHILRVLLYSQTLLDDKATYPRINNLSTMEQSE